MSIVASKSCSDLVREYAQRTYVNPARDRGERTLTINVGQVQKGVSLQNRVSLVCQALKSKKFLQANGLDKVSEVGPPSGQSTTVTYTYEFIDSPPVTRGSNDAWERLRGALKDVFAELGGGEAYLRVERASFDDGMRHRENLK